MPYRRFWLRLVERYASCFFVLLLVALIGRAVTTFSALLSPSISRVIDAAQTTPAPSLTPTSAPKTAWYTPVPVSRGATLDALVTQHATPECIPADQIAPAMDGQTICVYGPALRRDHAYNATWLIWLPGASVHMGNHTPVPNKNECTLARGRVHWIDEEGWRISADYIGPCPK